MEVWFEDYAKIKVRPSSHQTYQGYIDNHIRRNIGDIPLEKLTSLDLQKLYKKLLTKGRCQDGTQHPSNSVLSLKSGSGAADHPHQPSGGLCPA